MTTEMSMMKSGFSKVAPFERSNAPIRSSLKSRLRSKPNNNGKKQEDRRTMPSKIVKGKVKQRR